MSLLELPNEIVYMIIAETRPEGFEAFVLACKRVFQLAGSLLQRHNQFKFKEDYSILGNGLDSFNPIHTISSSSMSLW